MACHLYDGLCEDISDNVQQVWRLSALDLKGVDDERGHTVQITAGHFQRQQHQNREPVKEVVHGSPRKSPECMDRRNIRLQHYSLQAIQLILL